MTTVSEGAAIRAPAPLRILVVGLRGIIGVEGGIETHARRLYPLLARMGCRVEVLQRAPYYRDGLRRREWRGVQLRYLWSPTRSGLETGVHTLLGVLYAAIVRPHILHVHAVGPAFLAPLARLLGLRVVFTHHADDHRREKWGPLARWLLKSGERLGMRFANRQIVVSSVIGRRLASEYGVEALLVPNGAPRAIRARTTHALRAFDVQPGRYVLCVARIDATKRQADLIDAFERAELPGWKLVLVGAVDPANPYCQCIVDRAAGNPNIVLTGFQGGKSLQELYSHCGVFVLPSSLEGHPIALLEALSYGVPVLASAIPENMAIPMPQERFFPVGDVHAIARLLESIASCGQEGADALRRMVRERYSWRRAAQATVDVYHQLWRVANR